MQSKTVRIAVDIGGTFTDIALEQQTNTTPRFITAKTPTTPANPVEGAITAVRLVLEKASVAPSAVSTMIHGTTLATNALIEKKGAQVGVITTAGFRDILEIGYERRYNQYDIFIDKPDTLVPRERCYTIEERMMASGEVLTPLNEKDLNETGLDAILADCDAQGITSLAVCLLHAYANPAHEQRLAELIHAKRPDLFVSLSSAVSPEAREYDRLCTTVANAYVRPLMQTYLLAMADALKMEGIDCPLYLMTSGGGMTTLETAIQFPIRLVESGPSGGAILATAVAESCGLDQVISFDMGGTTAKICLIDEGKPQTSRHFEIARAERFMKGSGLPVRIPVIEMIEIGAGGGSLAKLDRLQRITVGPESAGAEPGPACFGRGGQRATVTDSDVVLGYIEPDAFAEGRLTIDTELATTAIHTDIGQALGLSAQDAASAITQVVDENMANAGRVHAVECGKALPPRTMIAFGGNGPLHATRVAEKMGVSHIVIPVDPGVGSAIGFLYAPISYEIVRSHYTTLDVFDVDGVNNLFTAMRTEAERIVMAGIQHNQDETLLETRVAFMRYKGQGHEIEVPLPNRDLTTEDLPTLLVQYETEYRAQFGRSVPGMVVEILNWAITISTPPIHQEPLTPQPIQNRLQTGTPHTVYFGPRLGELPCPLYDRAALRSGDLITGPALIVEAQTTTLVSPNFEALVDQRGNLRLERK